MIINISNLFKRYPNISILIAFGMIMLLYLLLTGTVEIDFRSKRFKSKNMLLLIALIGVALYIFGGSFK